MIDYTLKGIIKVNGDRIDQLRLLHNKRLYEAGICGEYMGFFASKFKYIN